VLYWKMTLKQTLCIIFLCVGAAIIIIPGIGLGFNTEIALSLLPLMLKNLASSCFMIMIVGMVGTFLFNFCEGHTDERQRVFKLDC